MTKKILLTSFRTWLPHQKSNSSDDLLEQISNTHTTASLSFLRLLPVDVELATRCVLANIDQIQPDSIVCCGMAESRSHLTVESNATCEDVTISTPVDLEQLLVGMTETKISHEAGKFVCEGLYYSVLSYLRDHHLHSRCIFVHVPVLSTDRPIVADFLQIINRLTLE